MSIYPVLFIAEITFAIVIVLDAITSLGASLATLHKLNVTSQFVPFVATTGKNLNPETLL